LDCATKIAFTAILSKIKMTASTAITAAMTRSLSETVFSLFT
jgi:antitoxin component of RelBE/YafQ-DinJ toxin-antitoxin module